MMMHIHTGLCMYVYMYVYMHVCMYVCTYIRMYIYVCMCMYIIYYSTCADSLAYIVGLCARKEIQPKAYIYDHGSTYACQ